MQQLLQVFHYPLPESLRGSLLGAQLGLKMSRIPECCQDENRDQYPRQTSQNIGSSPAVTRYVGVRDVDSKYKGKSIAIVDSPAEYTISNASVIGSKHFSYQ